MIIVNIIINGLVLLGKSKPETIDIPIKSGAFRLNIFPYINPLTYGFPTVFLWILGTQRARQLQAGSIFVAQGLVVRRCR